MDEALGDILGVRAGFKQVSADEFFKGVPGPLKRELENTYEYVEELRCVGVMRKCYTLTRLVLFCDSDHADARTFVKHYLPRRVTADTAAIVRGLEPQHELMRAACRMSRWINPDRPQELTEEQSSSVNTDPGIQQLLARRTQSKSHFNERQRQRAALLKQVQSKWDLEHPVQEIELQLSGFKFTEDVKATLDLSDEMPPIQRRLVETVMTPPRTTLEEKFRHRNAAIDAVAVYCKYEEGGPPRGRQPRRKASILLSPTLDPQVMAAMAEEKALNAAMLSVFTEKRPLICFVCLGRKSLSFEKRVYTFASPGDLTKHFKRKHLSQINEGQKPYCNICPMQLEHKMPFQSHAFAIHGTVS
ncbi:hypothetical protein B0O99DRAFT_656371 [Bisporella sp. PMI_857]|nr:hypothetical protein B0O99DRAFT_656371 [Bisporella sp. PMI_857]